MIRLVTGGTGFIGRNLLAELAKRDGTTYVLVRPASRERLEAYIKALGAADRMHPLAGDITSPALGLARSSARRLGGRRTVLTVTTCTRLDGNWTETASPWALRVAGCPNLHTLSLTGIKRAPVWHTIVAARVGG